MGRFLEKFKNGAEVLDNKANQYVQKKEKRPENFRGKQISQNPTIGSNLYDDSDDFSDSNNDIDDDFNDDPYDVNIQPAQKPESFHHFVLDNKYRHLERSIRGYKDVFNKHQQKWEVKRKEIHCFTDEEAESIVRSAEAHLSPDIKLARMSLDAFGEMMNLIYDELERMFKRIMEYRFGRYNKFDKDGNLVEVRYDLQGKMKDEAVKILVELYNNIWANYSRAVGGSENKLTHDSVRGQESLQNSGSDGFNNTRLR